MWEQKISKSKKWNWFCFVCWLKWWHCKKTKSQTNWIAIKYRKTYSIYCEKKLGRGLLRLAQLNFFCSCFDLPKEFLSMHLFSVYIYKTYDGFQFDTHVTSSLLLKWFLNFYSREHIDGDTILSVWCLAVLSRLIDFVFESQLSNEKCWYSNWFEIICSDNKKTVKNYFPIDPNL